MVAKTLEWKTEKIKHEFDSSFDPHPELRGYAEMAADYLDHEAGETYPATALWSVTRANRSADPSSHPSIHVQISDTTLGLGLGHDFTLEELKGRDHHFAILKCWTDFLRLRAHALHQLVFPSNGREEDEE
jgi:hypothetical protein